MRCLITLVLIIVSMSVKAQIDRIEPPNWWVGFNDNRLQLLIKGEKIGDSEISIVSNSITMDKVNRADSDNYLFLDLIIPKDAKPETFTIQFKKQNGEIQMYPYQLFQRKSPSLEYKGFDSSDAILLITPDRFANGDTENDIVKNMMEQRIDRTDDYARHGGDIRGIINHLDYIQDMGFTAIWSCPLLTNNMPKDSYHGYAITDYYEVDPRFGSLQEYKELADKAKEKGIKIIMDQVANHCGLDHWWMEDLPFLDWVNFQKEFADKEQLNTSNHRRTVNQDPYASENDEKYMSEGWFVSAMPDLNQKNPFLASYITQNSIWWIETLGLGGIRQDTYPYPDKDFMGDWAGAIMREYPNFNIVGEEWSYNPLLVGYWQHGSVNKDGYKSNLKTTMDFPMQRSIVDGLNENEGWDSGLIKIYEGLANDFYYPNPMSILLFADNHDMDRVYTQLNEDFENTKMAMGLILTLPRIPQIYYGTEILMQNSEKRGDHGLIRKDFPGGWEGDTINAFTAEGLTEQQLEMQKFLKELLNFRKTSEALKYGETVHFVPENGIYVLFRTKGNEVVMTIINKNEESVQLDLSRYTEMNLSGRMMNNLITDAEFQFADSLMLPSRGVYILYTSD